MDSPSSTAGSNDQMIFTPLEIESQNGHDKKSRLPMRVLIVPVDLLKRRKASDLFITLTFLLAVLSIFEYIWIRHLQAGWVRVPNDPFDIRFWRIDRKSPSIWDNERQSFIHNAVPVPVHSHNDYTRRIPLFEALGSGCISVEADVQLHDADLLIGHSEKNEHDGATLRTLYLEPLQRMLETQNADITDGTWRGLFDQASQQTFVLLIDQKSAGPETFAELDRQLQPLRDLNYLTYWNGTDRMERPLTIVASGTAPFESVMALNASHRDIFWDAPLDMLRSADDDFSAEPPIYAYNRSNSYFASAEWHRAKLYAWHNESLPLPTTLSAKDAEASQIEQAKARGLISRYWETPTRPDNLKEIAWRVLVDLQVGILNMDDMGAVRARSKGWGRLETSQDDALVRNERRPTRPIWYPN